MKLSNTFSNLIFSNERSISLKDNLLELQNNSKNLMTFNETTLGRPNYKITSPMRDLFKQDSSRVNEL